MGEPSYGENGFKGYSLGFRVFTALAMGFLLALFPPALYSLYLMGLGNQLSGLENLLEFDGPIAIMYFVSNRAAARAYKKGYDEFYRLNPSD